MPRHLESRLQQNCVTWFRLQYSKIGRLLFAVPNGGSRNLREAQIMKGEGVTAGVADMILLVPRGSFSSLCIEFKTDRGRQTDSQRDWQALTEQNSNKYVVCRSFDEFREAVEMYLTQR
jgi:hypothetical protein